MAVLGALLDRPDTELHGLEIARQRIGAGHDLPDPATAAGRRVGQRPMGGPRACSYRGSAPSAVLPADRGGPSPRRPRSAARSRPQWFESAARAPSFSPHPHYRGRAGMSGHRVLVTGDGEIFGGRRDRQVTARFRSGLALGPRSLWWVGSVLPSEEGRAWWAEVTSCLAETPISVNAANTCAAIAGRCHRWSGPAGPPRFVV